MVPLLSGCPEKWADFPPAESAPERKRSGVPLPRSAPLRCSLSDRCRAEWNARRREVRPVRGARARVGEGLDGAENDTVWPAAR
jgi:hypothetical protein